MSGKPDTDTDGRQEAKTALRNRYDRSEWAGAFGDLGILIPY